MATPNETYASYVDTAQSPHKQPLGSGAHETADDQRDLHISHSKDHLVQYPIEQWLHHCLETPAGSFWTAQWGNDVKASLREQQAISEHGWRSMPLNKPGLSEDETYQHTAVVALEVHDAAQKVHLHRTPGAPGLEQLTVYQTVPTKWTKSETPGPNLKPDGRFTLLPARKVPGPTLRRSPRLQKLKPEPEWQRAYEKGVLISGVTADCAALAEFKLHKHSRATVERQLLGGAAHLLYNDPRRRHVYGITMERESTRLWLFDRGVISVSEEFDFQKQPEYLIRMLLFLSFAPEDALGYDTTVKRVCDETTGTSSFVYSVGDKFYRTIGPPISEDNAFYVLSRGVRTWDVNACNEAGEVIGDLETAPIHVLKDAWQWDDVDSELEIQRSIKASLNAPDSKAIEKFFLTILECIDVKQRDNKRDRTIAKVEGAVQIQFVDCLEEERRANAKTSNVIVGSSNTQARTSQQHRHELAGHVGGDPTVDPRVGVQKKHNRRVHRRVVFEERCTPFYELDTFQKICDTTSGIAMALDLFRKAKYVHRDISRGNCLLYEKKYMDDSGKVVVQQFPKISDLEHCKRYTDVEAPHDAFTATFECLAVEAALGTLETWGSGKFSSASFMSRIKAGKDHPSASVPKVFHYHYLHDLESLWWMPILQSASSVVITDPHDPLGTLSMSRRSEIKRWDDTLKRWFFTSRAAYLARAILINQGFENFAERIEARVSLGTQDGEWWTLNAIGAMISIWSWHETIRDSYGTLSKGPRTDDLLRYKDSAFSSAPYKSLRDCMDRAKQELGEAPVYLRSIRDILASDHILRDQEEKERKKRDAAEMEKEKARERKAKRTKT